MQIDHLDHLVLTVQDIQTTCEFYSRVLSMQVVTFAEYRADRSDCSTLTNCWTRSDWQGCLSTSRSQHP